MYSYPIFWTFYHYNPLVDICNRRIAVQQDQNIFELLFAFPVWRTFSILYIPLVSQVTTEIWSWNLYHGYPYEVMAIDDGHVSGA